VPFIGYAVPTVRGEVKRFFRDCSWTVRIPRRLQDLQDLQGKTAQVLPLLAQELGREPTLNELADRMSVDSDQVPEAEAARAASTCCRWTGQSARTTATFGSWTSSPTTRTPICAGSRRSTSSVR
jgi:DNA-directed RNA polymerase specialized sigma subunit